MGHRERVRIEVSLDRLAELEQMCCAPSDAYSAGAWCEAANELVGLCHDRRAIGAQTFAVLRKENRDLRDALNTRWMHAE